MGEEFYPKKLGNNFMEEQDFLLDEADKQLMFTKKDKKSGFEIGGKNSSEAIANMCSHGLYGFSIDTILNNMLECSSRAFGGFLKRSECRADILQEILLTDNKYVIDQLGLTHQQLAKPLFYIYRLVRWWITRRGRILFRKPTYEFVLIKKLDKKKMNGVLYTMAENMHFL